ncbi:MAG: transposase [Candidatus Omnitrophica bacterium]|nr:transposase [Candidatus Omnitrophota bacterium]
MDLNSLVCLSLGLQEIIIERHQFSEQHQKLVIHAKLPLSEARCKKCFFDFLDLHQWHEKTIRIPTIGISNKVFLHLKYPRGHCFFCQKVMAADLYFIHPEFKGLSCSFVEVAGRMMEETTCAAAARLTCCNRKLLWKVDQWRMKYMKKYYSLPTNLDCSRMSADEVHFITQKNKKRENPFSPRRHIKYITNLVCSTKSKVVANASGREYGSLKNCLNLLSDEQKDSIKFFSLDMHADFFKAVRELCPNAEIAVDRYHLVESMNKVFNELRKDEFRAAKKRNDEFQVGMLEPGRRFILMQRNPDLSIEEHNLLGKLKMLNVNINAGMLIVDYFHRVLDQTGLSKFRERLVKWYGLVRDSKLKSFRKFALQVRKYRKNIEAYIKSNLTTAISEGLNNKIKVLKRMGYNYTNEKSFKNKILQRCGFLNSRFIDTNFMFWHVPYPQI